MRDRRKIYHDTDLRITQGPRHIAQARWWLLAAKQHDASERLEVVISWVRLHDGVLQCAFAGPVYSQWRTAVSVRLSK